MKKKKSQTAKMIQFKCTLLSFLNGLYIIIFFYIWSNSEGWWALRLVVCIHYPTWHPNLIQIKSFLDSRLCYEYVCSMSIQSVDYFLEWAGQKVWKKNKPLYPFFGLLCMYTCRNIYMRFFTCTILAVFWLWILQNKLLGSFSCSDTNEPLRIHWWYPLG